MAVRKKKKTAKQRAAADKRAYAKKAKAAKRAKADGTAKTTKRTRTKATGRKSAKTSGRARTVSATASAAGTLTSEAAPTVTSTETSGEERDPIQAEAAKEFKRHANRDGVFSCRASACMRGSRADKRASHVDDGRAWWVPAIHRWFCDEAHAIEYVADRY